VNARSPFQPGDLDELAAFLDRASEVVPMEEIYDATVDRLVTEPFWIGMRHDVDNVLAPAVAMAQWEAERNYRSTYFILHTAPYWEQKDTLREALEVIYECGHEIGFHLNAITAAIKTGRDPLAITVEALGELRSYGYPVRGVVAHGDSACYTHRFVNDELFTESRRPDYGAAERVIGGVWMRPVSRRAFGFEYDPNWLSRGEYLSDSGGEWSQPFDEVVGRWPTGGQLHMLVHPDWWTEAFVETRQAA
jgi:hypothetical protein